MSPQKTVDQLVAILSAGKFEPFISHIRFPRYKNIGVDGYTCVLHTDALNYSEAFAGSGEFAVVRLVVDILAAPER